MTIKSCLATAVIMLSAASPAHSEPIVKMGYFLFCAEHPTYCTQDTQGAEPSLHLLEQINRAVNHAITYAPDAPTRHGASLVLDYWTIEPMAGDCEDYTVTKLDRLLRAGIGRRYLRIAMGHENGAAHAVLLATVGGRAYLLDSLRDDVPPLAQAAGFRMAMKEQARPDGRLGLSKDVR